MSSASSKPVKTAGPASIPSVPWQPWLGVGFVLFIYYAAQIVAGNLILIYPSLRHWSAGRIDDWVNNSVGAQFVFILLAEALSVGAIYLFLRRYKMGLARIGLKKPRWMDPLYGLAAFPAYYLIYRICVAVISYLVPSLNVYQQQQIGFNSVHGSLPLVLTFLSLVVLPPLAEEIMVRGFLYSTFKKALPTAYAVLLTSALFAAAHLPEGGSAGPLYIAAIDTFILSLILIYLREQTGSLWASITLHALKNGLTFVYLFIIHAR
ncbi:MAG TPA: CPBP family intramembrane glutamic endopeptidase [Candidatus Saccharimonadales bacterium]|nr:CPBP family intramembrane glutamic endopeptidase [Candidatus Saccharimonadales bacterium]